MTLQDNDPNPTDVEFRAAHRRFVKVMEEQRLKTFSAETRRHYLAIIKSLTDKLALPSKPLSEVVGEIMAEAGPLIFQTMQH